MKLVFFEDSCYGDFDPLSLSHPVYMLLCGTSELYRKWVEALRPEDYSFLCREYLAEFLSLTSGKKVNELPDDDFVLVNGRYLPSQRIVEALRELDRGRALVSEGRLIACRLHPERPAKLTDALRNLSDADAAEKVISHFSVEEIKADGFRYLWELINVNGEMVARESLKYFSGVKQSPPESAGPGVINPQNIHIGENVSISPSVVIDAREGPVVIADHVSIEPFTYLQGPLFVGRNCRLTGGRIRAGCSFGPICRVGGEVEASIMLGFCNKYHDGFLGHAYLGEWVNLGAMTTNSDLKNNYSEIRVAVGKNQVDTGSIKVGCFIGDHTRTGIGTMFNTGVSVGFSCNLYGAGLFTQPRIRSFIWGKPEKLISYRLDKAVETAGLAMARRDMKMTAVHERLFTRIYQLDSGT